MSNFIKFINGGLKMFSTLFTKNNSTYDKELFLFLITLMKKHKVPVVGFAIIDNYEIISADTTSITTDIEASKDSLFQACSLSKSLTAFAVLKLATENKLNIDSSINQQIISWKIPESEYGEVSLQQCLNMTSGLCYGEINASFPGYTQDQPVPRLGDILNGKHPAHNLPIQLCYIPGSKYHYSGASYMVLQQLIEDKTGEPFADYMSSKILTPLKMVHSTFNCLLNTNKKINVIPGFKSNGEQITNGWENIVTAASGGLWSTPSDLANFVLAVTKAYLGIDNTILSKTFANEMLSHQENTPFSLGIVVDGEGQNLNFRKNGHNTGYHNEFMIFPHTGQGIVVMTNSATGFSIINDLISYVAEKYHWPCYSPDFNELTMTNTKQIKYP